MNIDELQSKTISFLRFPLIVGVVFIHNNMYNLTIEGHDAIGATNMHILRFCNNLFTETLSRTSVPLFFLISGYLFFYHLSKFSISTYKEKLKKRIHSLLIPYFFWNTVVLLALYLFTFYSGHLLSGYHKSVLDYNIWDFLNAFWNIRGETPIAAQFWFIRDLILLVIFTPLIYTFIKYLKLYGVLFLLLLWISHPNWMPPYTHGFVSITFFTAGAYLSINNKNIISCFKPFSKISIILYPIIVFIDVYTKGSNYNLYIHHIGILSGILFIFNLSAQLLENKIIRPNIFFSNASFFVFATHDPTLLLLRKALFNTFHCQNEIMYIIIYFSAPLLIITFCLICYKLLSRHLPVFTNIITGGR